MSGGETNTFPILLHFSYWEHRPAALQARLDELIRRGVTHLCSFVPWQAFEADIHHSLTKFLAAVAERKLTLSLILTPEVGIHHQGSGIPKDLLARPDVIAQSSDSKTCRILLPPLAFNLPSLLSPDFQKRYQSFMSKLDSVVSEQVKHHPWFEKNLKLHLTGSFWKYYRSSRLDPAHAFAGTGGDFSGPASLQFRQRLEQWLSQKEFDDPASGGVQRWKSRAMEEAHRRWFAQHSETFFRRRTLQFFRRKCFGLSLSQWELFTPEADPSISRRTVIQGFTRIRGDFHGLSALVDSAVQRRSWVDGEALEPWIHWSGIGGFRTLSDSEKQFLILKSLFLAGAEGGGVLIDESEWFSLSHGFRARAEMIARMLAAGELKAPVRAAYLTPHLWSGENVLWRELALQQGNAAKWVVQASELENEPEAALVIVDPSTPITKDLLFELIELARVGKLVAVANSPRFTSAAIETLERELEGGRPLRLQMDLPYRIQRLGLGHWVLYDVPETTQTDESDRAWKGFVRALLSVAGVPDPVRSSDSRLSLIELERVKKSSSALFILNPSAEAVSGELLFSDEVSVSDLPLRLSNPELDSDDAPHPTPKARRFGLEVPAFGILPLDVRGRRMADEDSRAAAVSADLLKSGIDGAARAELPGFDGSDGGPLWS